MNPNLTDEERWKLYEYYSWRVYANASPELALKKITEEWEPPREKYLREPTPLENGGTYFHTLEEAEAAAQAALARIGKRLKGMGPRVKPVGKREAQSLYTEIVDGASKKGK
ncbi:MULTISPECIES: hypothetical protein [unclassified Meiothermus]|uniref:hypothetical protein n=1 Tax=unclassified Meiothermus TaxID=370471 RepID=UPI000D7CD8D7|nr:MULTISPECIES: hypothetical protein [unclassified Meiothermus]PZA08723.1 hypothetical protein DNA98_01365 [Meiothermus sp. Pnk-1]RYM40657.1 hypothetical protein EWH23_00580 [Meiothermus sp. PNK-Is4]